MYARNFRRLYARYGPWDIVHSHVHYYSGVVLTLAAWLGVETRILHVHPPVDLKPPSLQRSLYRAAMFALLRRNATHLLACSRTSLDAAIADVGYDMPCRTIVYNGIDTSLFEKRIDRRAVRQSLGLPVGVPLICYVARFVPHKNHRQILRVASRLNEGGIRAHFVFAGSHGSELESVSAAAKARPDISLALGVEDVTGLLLASDAFVFPSLEEGFGIVALEAQAAGLPVIATNLATIKEACAPSHHDLMFPPDDDEGLLAQLRRILDDAPLRHRLGADGRAWVQRFSVESSLASLVRIYESATRPAGNVRSGMPVPPERAAGSAHPGQI
jgi:glycosyltransferase involved in cell wall biosynthesis